MHAPYFFVPDTERLAQYAIGSGRQTQHTGWRR